MRGWIPPKPGAALSLLTPSNDNSSRRHIRTKRLIPQVLPVTRTKIGVSAPLVDDLAGIATNGNGARRE